MQQVLVHIDHGLGPIGAWTYRHGALRHFYPESLDPFISARARDLMARRDSDVSIPEWMDLIADCDPTMLDEFQTFEVNDDLQLPTILGEFRRSWSASD
jgi:hypothetical protein